MWEASRSEPPAFSHADLERAARVLLVRSRREASSAFAGGYRSAFRGGGVEFEESRPYAPGDDTRFIDWNALARTGVPYVKRFREERDQTVLLVVDVSASMGFGSAGPSKAAAAAHAAALLTAAAARAGDRVGMLTFDERVREEIPPDRGHGHSWRILRALARAGTSGGATSLEAAIARIHSTLRRRSIVFLISDFRDDAFFAKTENGGEAGGRAALVALAAAHDLVAVEVHDRREEEIPAVGSFRVRDPERPARTLVLSSSRRWRERYQVACAVRRRALARRLYSDGIDVLSLRADRDPLGALARFFEFHVGARGGRATRAMAVR